MYGVVTSVRFHAQGSRQSSAHALCNQGLIIHQLLVRLGGPVWFGMVWSIEVAVVESMARFCGLSWQLVPTLPARALRKHNIGLRRKGTGKEGMKILRASVGCTRYMATARFPKDVLCLQYYSPGKEVRRLANSIEAFLFIRLPVFVSSISTTL